VYARRAAGLEGGAVTEEFVEKVHAARQKIADACEHDFEMLGDRFMRLQEEHPERLMTEISSTETPSGGGE